MTGKTQKEIDDELVASMLERKWSCSDCNHVYTEPEIRHAISAAKDNQNCPACGKWQD